jgi:hypothetical protein
VPMIAKSGRREDPEPLVRPVDMQGSLRHGPGLHQDYVRERHSDLLRQARAGELAARIEASREHERRSFLARLYRERAVVGSATG